MLFPKAAPLTLLTLLLVCLFHVGAAAQAGTYSGSTTFTVRTNGCQDSTTASFVTTINGAGQRSTSVSYNPTNTISCFTANPFDRHAITINGFSEASNPDGSFAGVDFSYQECFEQQTTGGVELWCFNGVQFAGISSSSTAPAISSFTATSPICVGSSSTLSWASTGGTSATITDLATGAVTSVPVNGSMAVAPNSSRTYRLTVTNAAGSVTADAAVTVNPLASADSFGASATTINPGQSTTLSWSSSNASAVSVTDLATGAVTPVAANGSLPVTPASSRTYRLTVSNGCNTQTLDVTVTVNQPPTISAFNVSPSPVCAGNSTTLTWSSSGGTSATITDLLTGSVTSVPVNGSLVVTPASSRTYRLTVSSAAGSVTSEVAVTVNPLAAINSFSASAPSINAGQSTNLNFNVSNTTARSITDLLTGNVTALGAESGALSVAPATTRTYRLTASNGCNTLTQDVTVTVTQAPAISAFAASASPVCSGGPSTLTWTATGGTSATISAPGLPGSPVSVNPDSGSLVVNPATTTTYTLTVSNGAGSVTSTATVSVTPAPAIGSYSASPSTINVTQSATLTWASTNGTSASITDLLTSSVTSVPVNGSLVVTPGSTRTYRLTVSGSCGTMTQDVTVTVVQQPAINSFAASTSPVCAGGPSTLSWSATGGTSATISAAGLPGSPVNVNPNSGTLVVNPSSTTTYTLTVSNSAGSVTSTATVAVTPPPAVSSFAATATTISAGQSTTLNFASTGGTSATITDLLTGSVTSVPVNGSLVVTPASSRSYRFTVTGACGTDTRDVSIVVNQAPTISTLTASPASVCPGASTTLSWTSSGGTTATITDLVSGSVTPVQPSGSLSVTPATTRTYRLTVSNSAGSVTQDVAVTVIAPASITTFSASATAINAGGSVTFTYAVAGPHNIITLLDRQTGIEQILASPSGTVTVSPASSRGYNLLVGTDCQGVISSAIINVTVTQPPTVSSFAATPNPVCAGSPSTLSWTSSGATSATITDLTSGAVNAVPVNGSLSVTPASSRSYRLTVTNGAGSAAQDVAVTVTPLAAINGFSASATTINAGQSVAFTFAVSNTTSRSITDLATGQVTGLGVESGTATFSPATTRTYRLTASNGCNTLTQDVTVTVNQPPSISSLSASPSSLCAGASTTLSWTSSGGTSATITDLTSGGVTSVPVSGTLAVSPASTRAYRLTVTNVAGSATADVTVTVIPPASISSFTASPSSTTATQGTTLDWFASGTSATITDLTTGTVTNVPVSGSFFVSPSTTRAYRLTVTNACGTATRDVTVTILSTPAISSFTASPTPICRGASSTLSWSAAGGTSAYITGSGLPGSPVNVNPNSGTLVVTPTTTTTYTLTVVNDDNPDTDTNFRARSVTVTVSGVCSGNVLLGPQGQPAAVGPTNNNDDYTNRTLAAGVAVPFGGVTTAAGTITFTNTLRNNAAATDSVQLSILAAASGVTAAQISIDGGNTFAATQTVSLAPAANRNVLVRVTLGAGISVLTGYAVTVRATSVTLGNSANNTINRSWTGFVRVDKSASVTNSTGVGGPNQAVPGAIIRYSLAYSNVTPAASGTGNVELFATNLTLTEDGNQAPNNWGTLTVHVPGQATDSRGGTITGDTAGSTLLTDVIARLDPSQSGVFRFDRRVK